MEVAHAQQEQPVATIFSAAKGFYDDNKQKLCKMKQKLCKKYPELMKVAELLMILVVLEWVANHSFVKQNEALRMCWSGYAVYLMLQKLLGDKYINVSNALKLFFCAALFVLVSSYNDHMSSLNVESENKPTVWLSTSHGFGPFSEWGAFVIVGVGVIPAVFKFMTQTWLKMEEFDGESAPLFAYALLFAVIAGAFVSGQVVDLWGHVWWDMFVQPDKTSSLKPTIRLESNICS